MGPNVCFKGSLLDYGIVDGHRAIHSFWDADIHAIPLCLGADPRDHARN